MKNAPSDAFLRRRQRPCTRTTINHWFVRLHRFDREFNVLELHYMLLMEQPNEYETEKATTSQREWLVEYDVDSGDGLKRQHLSILNGLNMQDVQVAIFAELRKMYPLSERLEVTITRLEPITTHTEVKKFDLNSAYTS